MNAISQLFQKGPARTYTLVGKLLLLFMNILFALAGMTAGFLLGYLSIIGFVVVMAALLLFAWYGDRIIKRFVLFRFSYEYRRMKLAQAAFLELARSSTIYYHS